MYPASDKLLHFLKGSFGRQKELIAISRNPIAEVIARINDASPYSNKLIYENDIVTDVDLHIRDAQDKLEERNRALSELEIRPQECMTIINGRSDLLMTEGCPLVIAAPGTKSKEVFERADIHVGKDYGQLLRMLY
jgi:phosphoserine phosphatase